MEAGGEVDVIDSLHVPPAPNHSHGYKQGLQDNGGEAPQQPHLLWSKEDRGNGQLVMDEAWEPVLWELLIY